ncbi:MAG: ComF family protein [Verrucomicrobia bacterium]|nr:ComF family protein [Verrucomicrobiota bacterium]
MILFHSLLHLLFPQSCLHCSSELAPYCRLLCPACFELLELLEPEGRCPYCFAESDAVCATCQQKRPSADFVAACFEYTGPAKTLIKEFKYQDSPGLATSLGSFLVLQFLALKWPLPDVVTFVPQSFIRTRARGYNQSKLLAYEFGKCTSRPVVELLRKTQSSLSQSRLTKKEREAVKPDLYAVKRPQDITHKAILLIDDVYTTGTTIDRCASALKAHAPSHIYVLTVCTAVA